jgi:hypothetical protein
MTCKICERSIIGEICSLCCKFVCVNCIDWKCMLETDTDQVVCKECSQLFENCKNEEVQNGSSSFRMCNSLYFGLGSGRCV